MAHNTDITQSQVCDRRHRRMQDVNSCAQIANRLVLALHFDVNTVLC